MAEEGKTCAAAAAAALPLVPSVIGAVEKSFGKSFENIYT